MSNKKTSSVVIILDALAVLKVTMTSQDVRRLVVITKATGNASGCVQTLRTIVSQYRLDPLSVLNTKGIGVKTFETIQKLSKVIAAQDKKRDYGMTSDVQVVQTILNNMNAYMPASVKQTHTTAKNVVQKLGMELEAAEIERGLQHAVKTSSKANSKTKPSKRK